MVCSQKQASMEGALGAKLLRERSHTHTHTDAWRHKSLLSYSDGKGKEPVLVLWGDDNKIP